MGELSSLQRLRHHLIVSCQAPDGDPFRTPDSIARFAVAAELGGAGGIRANGPDDVRAIRKAVALPIIGIYKRVHVDGRVLITPSFEDARAVVEAGADILALDCTARGQSSGALERLRRIRAELRVPVMADIATLDEAGAAVSAGADLVGSTMRGYTAETAAVVRFEPDFIAALATNVKVPVIAEGRVQTPADAGEAIRAGAYAVVVGTAITRPKAITSRFAAAVKRERKGSASAGHILGLDLGGTNTKAGLVSRHGCLGSEFVVPTPVGGSDVLLHHLNQVTRRGIEIAAECGVPVDAIGVATAGWVDSDAGRVVYATDNLAGWTGAHIADELRTSSGLGVAVENDAYALAVAEHRFGAARGVNDFVCLTLGTGIGGGCYSGGRLVRGAHSLASALGHISVQHDGPACSCGLRGCLEMYGNAAALLRYAGPAFDSAEAVIRAANSGDRTACEAVATYAGYLSTGIASIIHFTDPTMIVLGGGLTEANPLLFRHIEQELGGKLIAAQHRRVRVCPSSLGYYGGVLGAAVVAMERLR